MAKRPAGVTLVAVITWIIGALQVIGGVLLLIGLATSNALLIAGDRTWLTVYAVVAIVIGVVVVAVAGGLRRGRNSSRVIVTIALLLSIVGAVFTAITLPAEQLGSIVTAFLDLIAIILLYTGRASDFFRR
jgi:hypothetical protein